MFVEDEGQKFSASKPLKAGKSISPVSLASRQKQPLSKMHAYPSADGDKSAVRSSEVVVKTFLTKNSAAARLAAKSSAVRSSCHDACKFGHHHVFAELNDAKSGGKTTAKKAPKVSAAKVSKLAVATVTAKINKSPVKSRDSGASVKKPALKLNSVGKSLENMSSAGKSGKNLSSVGKSGKNLSSVVKSGKKLSSVHKSGDKASLADKSSGKLTSAHKSGLRLSPLNGDAQLSSEKSVKSTRSNASTPESKFKVTRSLFRSPRPPSESLKILTSKISIDDISSSVNFQQMPPKTARSLMPAFDSPRLSRAFSSELSFKILDDKAEEEFFRQFSPMENAAKSQDEISFEAFSGYQSSEYSEISPRSLEACLQEAYDYVGKTATNAENMKMRLRRRREADRGDSNAEPESVVLKHQDVQGRKPSEEYLINHAIEEAVNKLSHSQEGKVKVLVGAFETVMNLRDSQTVDDDHEGKKLESLSTNGVSVN